MMIIIYVSATLDWKHWTSEAHLEDLKELQCLILHEIDVEDMNEHEVLKNMKFDRIIFNFPHAGHDPLLKESDKKLIMYTYIFNYLFPINYSMFKHA